MTLFRGIGARKDAVRGTTPIEVRKTVAALFARPGVLPGGASPLLTGDATWAYNVGIANFVTSRGATDGDQLFGNDSVALIGATGVGSTVPIAPGAGLQRIDIAWTRHPTNLENADTASEPLFGVASGTAAATAVAPVIPAGALELGRNLMTNAATSTASAGNTITQSALFTALRGAPVPVRNQTERDNYAADAGLSDGLRVYRLDLHCVETYNGTAWGMASLTVTASSPAISGNVGATLTQLLAAPAVTGDGVKKFKITFTFYGIKSTVSGDTFDLCVTKAGVTIGAISSGALTTSYVSGRTVTIFDTPAAGSTTYAFASARSTGTGAANIFAAATAPIQIIVEQIA